MNCIPELRLKILKGFLLRVFSEVLMGLSATIINFFSDSYRSNGLLSLVFWKCTLWHCFWSCYQGCPWSSSPDFTSSSSGSFSKGSSKDFCQRFSRYFTSSFSRDSYMSFPKVSFVTPPGLFMEFLVDCVQEFL